VTGAVGGGVAGGVVAGAEVEPGPRAATGPDPGADGLGPAAGVDCCAPILTYATYFLHVLDHHLLALLDLVFAFLTKSESGP
jgi:hypothetical protein